eukprot:1886229-Rhodomonas_salina.2
MVQTAQYSSAQHSTACSHFWLSRKAGSRVAGLTGDGDRRGGLGAVGASVAVGVSQRAPLRQPLHHSQSHRQPSTLYPPPSTVSTPASTVWGLESRVQGLGSRASGLGSRA